MRRLGRLPTQSGDARQQQLRTFFGFGLQKYYEEKGKRKSEFETHRRVDQSSEFSPLGLQERWEYDALLLESRAVCNVTRGRTVALENAIALNLKEVERINPELTPADRVLANFYHEWIRQAGRGEHMKIAEEAQELSLHPLQDKIKAMGAIDRHVVAATEPSSYRVAAFVLQATYALFGKGKHIKFILLSSLAAANAAAFLLLSSYVMVFDQNVMVYDDLTNSVQPAADWVDPARLGSGTREWGPPDFKSRP